MNRENPDRKSGRIRFPVLAILALLGAFVLLLWLSTHTDGGVEGFQALPEPSEAKLQWAFVTRDGGELSEYGCLLPDAGRLEDLAGMPVEITVCTADKFMNLIAAGAPVDVATRCYADPKLKRFETSGKTENLQQLLDRELPGFQLPSKFRDWCGNTKGDVYAYPHTISIGRPAEVPSAGVVMLANKQLLEAYSISLDSFSQKEAAVNALKTIRKAEPQVIPSYIDLISLQQMFGARTVNEKGVWQDKFSQEETLEALEFMNCLYRERLLSRDVFTMTQGYLLSQLREEKVFLVSTGPLYPLLQALPEDDPLWEVYEIVGPIVPDSGKPFQFQQNYDEQYASTIFLTGSDFPKVQVRLLLWFYCQNMEPSPEQRQAADAGGLGTVLEAGTGTPAPKAVGGIYEEYAQPEIPYEILFSHYADTRLANIFESVESYRSAQEVRIITSTPESEVEQIYRETLLEMENRNSGLLVQWKQNKYWQATLLAAPEE
ncbi:hypothetical protein D7X94_02220 [Acutalibacter sp. 1XD8-33]|uniref:hypothetical protein n=1 Tax=Acutalibacter sp. 1XD8-33 TaxID=2320081 RepID=UPI000EA37209|nr:hypothetical protein [Acutalibacter sp. 1XD8-33]RKJ41649.1 hypothetical protein D7X94_02220 [Acutalibacter sp. 1XD8-33]